MPCSDGGSGQPPAGSSSHQLEAGPSGTENSHAQVSVLVCISTMMNYLHFGSTCGAAFVVQIIVFFFWLPLLTSNIVAVGSQS